MERQLSASDAQHRVEQIQAFKQEMQALQAQGVLSLAEQQHAQIDHYHRQLLQTLSAQFDLDTNLQAKQLSLGMKVASLLGALAMAASIFFLFYQFWGYFTTSVRSIILLSAPLLLLVLTWYLAEQAGRTYFAKIAALVCLCSFVLNLQMLGQLFNITPSPNAFLMWAAFALILAYLCHARLLLFFAILCFASFIAMQIDSWSGLHWLHFAERPEHFFIPSLILFFVPQRLNQQAFVGFASMYRVMALLLILLPILVLSNWGQLSYLSWNSQFIEGFYQLTGFILSTLSIYLGIKRHWSELVNTGTVFFILFLFSKFFDWWWDWLPKYLFFFVVGLTAVLALMVFKRLRLVSQQQEVAQ